MSITVGIYWICPVCGSQIMTRVIGDEVGARVLDPLGAESSVEWHEYKRHNADPVRMHDVNKLQRLILAAGDVYLSIAPAESDVATVRAASRVLHHRTADLSTALQEAHSPAERSRARDAYARTHPGYLFQKPPLE